jgi:Homeodomain-like domain
MNVRYRVELTQYERNELGALLSGGKHPARKLKRAQILLATDAGVSDEDIATSVGVGGSTVYRTKRRFVEGNLERALSEEARPGAERKLTRRRKPYWWRQPARARRRAAPAGRWSCWRRR